MIFLMLCPALQLPNPFKTKDGTETGGQPKASFKHLQMDLTLVIEYKYVWTLYVNFQDGLKLGGKKVASLCVSHLSYH